MPNAGHVGNPISHTKSMKGLIGGLIVGAVVGAALAVAVVATGGAALIAVAAAGAAVAGGGGLGQVLGSMSWAGVDITGALLTGSFNVFVNGKLAAHAHLSTGACAKHGPSPQLLAQGSDSVFVNGLPFGRVGDLFTCSGKLEEGSSNVFVGGGTATTDEISPEIPAWVNWTLGAVGFASAVILAGPIVAVLATVGGMGGGVAGEWLGGKLFGEGSDGQKWMMLGGSLAGGFLGAKGGIGLGNKFIPQPSSATSGFIKGGVPGVRAATQSRGAYLRSKYGHMSAAERTARIDQLSQRNYQRIIAEKIDGQDYVFRYLSEKGLADSYKYNSVKGYTTTQFSGSGSEVARGAQILPAWGDPKYGVAIPKSSLQGFEVARPMGNTGSAGWEVYTNSYPAAGPGGWDQFLINSVPLNEVHIFTLKP